MHWPTSLLALALGALSVRGASVDACPGYKASKVQTTKSGLTADLLLAGKACNVYGEDVEKLKLEVTYETESRIHVKITDPAHDRYEVPDVVFPRPNASSVHSSSADISFKYTTTPFSFSIVRAHSNEVLFSTGRHPIVFEPQYLRLMTDLPRNPNIYGLGEHTDTFRLPTSNYTRTMWSRDAYGVRNATNLYGNHPIYFEHRTTGTHGVFLLNSDGMDIKINDSAATSTGSTLEYNVVGGVLDFYFFAGSTSQPAVVAQQYAELAGTPAEVPYWSFGLHQCRFGYQNYIDVAQVIMNYSAAGIPLETMWTDIDYMYKRRVFSLDPQYFPLNRMQEIVGYLHDHDQHYVMMVDPAVAYQPEDHSYLPYHRGESADVWLKRPNGSEVLGVVWPGVTVYPDWFKNNTQDYWTNEFEIFFNPETGVNIDGVWIDMNEPSSFCNYPCTDPFQQAIEGGYPPNRTSPVPNPNAPILGQSSTRKRAYHGAGENLEIPPYMIQNAAGPALGAKTADTDAVHANGLVEYDTHNVYGDLMSFATRNAMEARRPGNRTLVITRSTFAGAGKAVGKWLGDNLSDWWHYRVSIAGMLGMATVYQIPMVGSDICGFGADTTETLCARWAMLGAFSPFMRNHNQDTSIPQEFYRWPVVAAAARNALDIRYRLMDYLYTAFHQQHVDGTPVVSPVWFAYPSDPNTFGLDLQFLYGSSVLVSPVTDENATTVSAYLPRDILYDFTTLAPVHGQGAHVELTANFTTIPLHIRGGAVLPLRVSGAMTTAELRKTDFELVVAPGSDGTASGALYADDGESIVPPVTTSVKMAYAHGKLSVSGSFTYPLGVNVARVRVLGVPKAPQSVMIAHGGKSMKAQPTYHSGTQVLDVPVGMPFTQAFTMTLG